MLGFSSPSFVLSKIGYFALKKNLYELFMYLHAFCPRHSGGSLEFCNQTNYSEAQFPFAIEDLRVRNTREVISGFCPKSALSRDDIAYVCSVRVARSTSSLPHGRCVLGGSCVCSLLPTPPFVVEKVEK